MRNRTIVILAALAIAAVGTSMVTNPWRYYVPPSSKAPDPSAEPPKGFKTAVRAVGAVCMAAGAVLTALLLIRER